MMELVTKEQLDEYIEAYANGHPKISDEEYDALLEEYLEQNGEENRPFLRQKQSDAVNDIVGTLPKVYGTTVPMRKKQKVYTDWLRVKNISGDTPIIIQPKFDGCSVALDVFDEEYFTRGNVDDGESEEVTVLFDGRFKPTTEQLEMSMPDAIKYEAILSHEIFDKIFSEYKRPRDFVSGTLTSFDKDKAELITLIPLREYHNRKEYIPDELEPLCLKTIADDIDAIDEFIKELLSNGASVKYNNMTYSCDGVVVSTLHSDGSTGYEVAIKILSNIKEAKLLNIEWQFGKTGKITPVGILEKVYFDNIEVDHVTLSTLDRVLELGLKYNDTVRIVYNIVPYLIDTYKDGTYPIPIPKKCPICGAELNMKTLKTVRCTNPNCSGLKIGLIHRYCEKMKMVGIAKSTVSKLYEAGLINSIGDLYRLTPEKIMTIDGFKEKSANNIVNSIFNASKNIKLEKWLGALPIKDISEKTWKILIDAKFTDRMIAVNVVKNVIETKNPEAFISECMPVYVRGCSVNIYAAIREGLVTYWEDIKDIIQYITFDFLTDLKKHNKGRVSLTGTRDEKLTSYLLNKGYEVDDFSSKTIALIIPSKDFVSNKVQKARSHNIPIYTIEEAYEAL